VERVYMRHPALEDREPVEVPVSAIPFHVNAGWEVVEAPGEGGVPEAEEKPIAEPRKRPSRAAVDEKKEDGN
jgi:hypothetical protein